MTREQRMAKKFSPSEMNEINKAFNKLKYLIAEKERYGTAFEYIYNDDSIKYDIFGKGFYSFKARGKDKAQIRILYRFERTNNKNYILEIHMVVIKRRDDKTYIKIFKDYVNHYI